MVRASGSAVGEEEGGGAAARSNKLSRKFSGSARFRVLIDRAQQTLDEKNLSYQESRAIREHLQRLLNMLTAATVPSQPVSWLHELALRTKSVPHAPVPAEEALIASSSCPALESLPTCYTDYNDAMLDRINTLRLGDFVALFKSWSARISNMVVHVSCHGSHSHFSQQFEDAVLQFAVFHTVHAWTMPHQQLAAAGINMLTGQRAQPPEGWYDRVARLLPADKQFALLVKSGLDFIQSCEEPSQHQRNSCARAIVEALARSPPDGVPAPPEHVSLVELEAVLDKYCQLTHSAMRHRVMVSTYLFTSMWTRFGPSTMAQILCNCWPFSIRGIVIFDAYLKRAEVAKLLSESESDYLAFDAAPGATDGPAAAAVAAGGDMVAAQAGSGGAPDPASLGFKDNTAAAGAVAAVAAHQTWQTGPADVAVHELLQRVPPGEGLARGDRRKRHADGSAASPAQSSPTVRAPSMQQTDLANRAGVGDNTATGAAGSNLRFGGPLTAALSAQAVGAPGNSHFGGQQQVQVKQDIGTTAVVPGSHGHGLLAPGSMLLHGLTFDLGPGSSSAGGQRIGSAIGAHAYQDLGMTQALDLGAGGGMLQVTQLSLGSLLQQQLWGHATAASPTMHSMAAPRPAGAHHAVASPSGGTPVMLPPSWPAGLQGLSGLGGLQLQGAGAAPPYAAQAQDNSSHVMQALAAAAAAGQDVQGAERHSRTQ